MKIYLILAMILFSMITTPILTYKLGVSNTTERVNRVLNTQANAKLQDSTFRAMTREFPEDVQ